jgi:hypothetical protein
MEDRKEIILAKGVKGIIVYAKHNSSPRQNWILLIDKVDDDTMSSYDDMIYTHVSHCPGTKTTYFENAPRWGWVNKMGFRFYEATEEEKKIINDLLKSRGLKYVKGINKVFKR